MTPEHAHTAAYYLTLAALLGGLYAAVRFVSSVLSTLGRLTYVTLTVLNRCRKARKTPQNAAFYYPNRPYGRPIWLKTRENSEKDAKTDEKP